MRRCKFCRKEIDYIPWCMDYYSVNICSKNNQECWAICTHYTPVEVDPYWAEFVEEINRRLNDAK